MEALKTGLCDVP